MSLNKIPEILSTTVLYEESFFQLRKEKLKIDGGEGYDYYTLESFPVAVMVIATTPQNEYVLNWEYRHPVRKILLSSPGGIMHNDESPIECAKRELLEETGYAAEHLEIAGEAYPFPGITPQKTFFVRGYNATKQGPPHLERAEFIETELFSQEKLKKLLQNHVAADGLLLTALYFAQNL
jgi:ADP-ribose pyrophosphatase